MHQFATQSYASGDGDTGVPCQDNGAELVAGSELERGLARLITQREPEFDSTLAACRPYDGPPPWEV
jgi:hypothetical protein